MAFLSQLNLVSQCRKYRVPLWQCPQFIFLIMGSVIISSTLLTYFIGSEFISDPLLVAIVVLGLTALLFLLDFIITQSFERLAQVAQMRADFVSIVSHQLRAPLSNLRWAIEALNLKHSSEDPAAKVEYLAILKENSQRMRELVADLLTVSRLEEGRLPSKKEYFSLSQIVNETLKAFQPFILARNLKVEFKAPKKLALCWIDPKQIRQVVENLLDNAIQYTKGGGKILINLSQKDKEILFQIKDTGIGIPQPRQKYIFKKFFRAENAKRRQAHGSGLGLFIAKTIIERAGGKIWFESKEGKGSTFFFMLPIK